MRYWFLVLRKILLFALTLIFLVTLAQFFVKPYFVDGRSMLPTLTDGDLVIFLKFNIGFQYFYLPKRGDIVLIKVSPQMRSVLPRGKYIIKRIVGLPTDLIEIKNNSLVLNNETVFQNITGKDLIRYPFLKKRKKLRLNGDEYFVLGDNLEASIDSRHFGPVKRERIVGKALLRIWPFLKLF